MIEKELLRSAFSAAFQLKPSDIAIYYSDSDPDPDPNVHKPIFIGNFWTLDAGDFRHEFTMATHGDVVPTIGHLCTVAQQLDESMMISDDGTQDDYQFLLIDNHGVVSRFRADEKLLEETGGVRIKTMDRILDQKSVKALS